VEFPLADTDVQFEAVAEDEAVLRPALLALCDHLGIVVTEVERFPVGSSPVYAVDDEHVLKLFPGVYLDEMRVEREVLGAVDGRLPVPTPGVLASGEFGGWGYVLMRRLTGESLKVVWPGLNREQRIQLATRVGEALAVLHEVPAPELEPADWQEFIARQGSRCVERQRVRHLQESWVEQIPGFLESVDLGEPKTVLLHTEVMSDHLLVTPDLELSGLFDFEPAMRGAAEYEFVATGIFLTRGDLVAHEALLRGYGYREIDRELPRRLLAYALLHVYSNLPWYLREIPPGHVRTLDGLADLWFGAPGR
jgi:hygromycin-B 7''-O-kinase